MGTLRNALVVVGASLVASGWNAFGSPVFTITGKRPRACRRSEPSPLRDHAQRLRISFGELVDDFGGGLAVIPFMDYWRALPSLKPSVRAFASPPRSVVLDCHHVNTVDYTVVNELRDLLRQFKLRGVGLIFSGLQYSVLEVLLAADLPGLRHTASVEAALTILLGGPLVLPISGS
ncbi:unnamed protein product [Coregonus sp. 'balchen']|nr:unnamed protein product [Coregonus sp. 'balchen']